MVPRAKASSASLHHPLLVSYILMNICYWLLSSYHLVFLLRLQHLSKSKVSPSAAVLHRPHWHKGRGSQVAHARSLPRARHRQCSLHHKPCFLQHWDTAVQTKWALEHKDGKFLLVLSSTESSMHSRILIPQLQNMSFFTMSEGFSWWSDSMWNQLRALFCLDNSTLSFPLLVLMTFF